MTVLQSTWLSELQALVTNRLDCAALESANVAAIIGDAPSTYAKSPRLWNAAFQALQWKAVYIPLDVPQGRLRRVLDIFRGSERWLGGSVTVPYKTEIPPLLDAVDPMAARIGAVNVIARARDGRLVGYNTDGAGGVRALVGERIGEHQPPCQTLSGARVLLMGSGGAARAVGCSVWDQLAGGEIVIANRSRQHAHDLVQRLAAMRPGRLCAINEEAIAERAADMDIVINATVKGQAGWRRLADGTWTSLEPYSALAPAQPAAVTTTDGASAARADQWFRDSRQDLCRNLERSLELCARLPRRTVCYDLVYAPLETTFLRHARWSGHATLNGKAMNILQAVEAFVRYVCRPWLEQHGWNPDETAERVMRAMAEAWAA